MTSRIMRGAATWNWLVRKRISAPNMQAAHDPGISKQHTLLAMSAITGGLAHVDEQRLHVVKEQGDEHDEDGDDKLSAHQVDAALLQHSASVALTHEGRATVDEAQGNAKRDDVVEGDAEPGTCEQVRVIQVANEVEALRLTLNISTMLDARGIASIVVFKMYWVAVVSSPLSPR
eukprot:CAMPEP_0185604736 /NCGR_PEP_ID=MMETSP0436-20130131/3513_1 /TAXON_ID=626734 ORGANISM="Favella taraikaensis, Strain Fe Narragansett Bay" /NCGR_SAMPLE_ID=MMETSP0436 /ASSEMBLY_ACC=CAM_ASM_000390 /LENGTH=174 /DNA_ID=CAMNT_0028235689 /DNA_START=976 /DNA_END=1497 /DNA_ORIENTATION=-